MWIQDINGGAPRPVTPEGVAGFAALSPDDKWLIAGRRAGGTAVEEPVLVSVDKGSIEPVRGAKPDDRGLGWSADGQVYIASAANGNRASVHIDKLNPHTGVRTPWRDLAMPPLGGIFPDPPIITPDGATYGYDYRLRLSDLYTVNGVR
jgi:hypothetical protein